jgi:diguanylate cyclase (GGDEF)-like protein
VKFFSVDFRGPAWFARAFVALLAVTAGATSSTEGTVDAFLVQAQAIQLTDHPRFAAMLAQIHADNPVMTPAQKWKLRYLDAWEASFNGRYLEATGAFKDIAAHSGDEVLAAKSMGKLLSAYASTKHYEEVFTLAEQAVAMLDRAHNREARYALLSNLSQAMTFSGQPEIAVRYALMMAQVIPEGETVCRALAIELAARYETHKLRSNDPKFKQAIDACNVMGDKVFANMLWLTHSELLVEEHKPLEALAVLDRIAPSVVEANFHAALTSLTTQRAQAFDALRRDDEARQRALEVVGMYDVADIDVWLRDAYQVLYNVAKRRGDSAAALEYFKKFSEQDHGNLDDERARALAYQAVRQRTLVAKVESENLARQNEVLRAEQLLTLKSVEIGRLYIALLGIVLVSVAVWFVRVRRSRNRFQWLAHHDGLTGTLTHQQFMAELEATLAAMRQRDVPGCVILLDLDHFKAVNDQYGHAMGDIVLQHVVDVCRAQLRPGDLLGRLGGEEFGVLLPDCLPEQGLAAAERIREALDQNPATVDGVVVQCSTSAGVSSTRFSGHDLKRLRNDADRALYEAKRGGRNRVVAGMQADRTIEV